jgi:hypothetical protein
VISRRLKAAAIGGALTGAALVGGFAPAVRYGAERAGERYGAKVSIERVSPAGVGVRLLGVDVVLEEIPSARVHVESVTVAYRGSGRSIGLQGGVVSLIGARSAVLQQIEAWRARHLASGEGAGSGGASKELDLAGVRLSWQDAAGSPSESVSASDLRVSRSTGRITVEAREATATLGRATVSVKGGKVELARGEGGGAYQVAGLSADAVDADVLLPSAKGAPSKEAKVPGDVPTLPRALGVSGLRATLTTAARGIDLSLVSGATVHLGGVRVRVRHEGDVLNLGPGALSVARADGRLVVELTPELRGGRAPAGPTEPVSTPAPASPREEALTFRLAVPLSEGGSPAAREIVADVNGGPIWLSSLGVNEGDFGLFNVGTSSLTTRSHLALSADGRTLRIDGEGKVHALSLRSSALSDEPVAGLELAFSLKGEVDLDGSRARIADSELDLGAIRLALKGDFDRVRNPGGEETYRIRGSFDVPLTGCQAMLDSTPKGLVPKLQGMRLAGSFALRGQADVDTAHLDRGYRVTWDATSSCRIVEAPATIHVERFRKPFKHAAYDAQGRQVEVESGPGTPEWTPGSAISKFMEAAVLTTEDGGFHRHHGFDHEAIKNSIRENLRKKKFVRGASTISMQLAKNLYLDRGKNLSRKLQEAVLTMYLEQELTKEQILELYFNVVEFGPMVYGIGPAARSYFSTRPADLTLGQALYISSIMPSPKVQHFGAGGAVAPGWMSYLHKLMKIARDRSRITDEELEEGLRETVIRGSPSPQRSAKPVGGVPIDPTAPPLPDEPVEVWP